MGDCNMAPCDFACDGEYLTGAGGDGNTASGECGDIEEACQGHINWAMDTGINTNPEWYPNLTPDSTVNEFQCLLAASNNVPDCNNLPCDFDCSAINAECSTAAEGDECFGHDDWAMNTGIYTNPEWYPGLDSGSDFEAFQCELVLSPNVPDCWIPPCNYECDGDYLTAAGGDGECSTSTPEDACFGHIMWAMETGIVTNPEWYPNVNADSSFEAFQCQLLFDPYHIELGDCVDYPCGVSCVEGQVEVSECGGPEDACLGHIDWAMNTGIYTNPEWCPGLDSGSAYEAFQCELALSVNVPDCNMAPCDFACDGEYLTGAGGDGNAASGECGDIEEACQGHINWAMDTGINTNPEWYPNLTPDSTVNEFQCMLAASNNVPDCNNLPCDFDCSAIN